MSSIDGLTLNFAYLLNDFVQNQADVKVQTGIEFSTGGADIDISGFRLNWGDIEPPWGSSNQKFVISDKFDVLPDITSVTFTENAGLWEEWRVTFDKNSITVNVKDMDPVKAGLQFVLTIGFSPTKLALAAGTVKENDPGAVIGSLSNNDFDGTTKTYEIVDSNGKSFNDSRFEIVGDQLRLTSNTSLDYEATPTVSLYIKATDGDGKSHFEQVTFNVTNANDKPSSVSLTKNVIRENDKAVGEIGTLVTSDQDAGDTFKYEIVDSVGNPVASSDFLINGSKLELKPGVWFDHETTPTVTVYVKTTDTSLESHVQALTIDVANVNEKPTDITLSPNSVVENDASGISIGKLATTDEDLLDKFSYSIVDSLGNDLPSSIFEIGAGGDLRLKAGAALDFEAGSTVKVFVKTTDSWQESFVKELTVNVTDDPSDNPAPPTPANAAPTLTVANADAAAQVGTALNLTIGDGHFVDPEGADLNYSITVEGAAAPSWISFNSATGALTANPTSAGQFTVVVTASDGSLTTSDEFELIVTAPAAQNIRGTRGDDRNLIGGGGDDTINGKKGDDRMTGGDGADTFVFSAGHDKVLDFDGLEGDLIDLGKAKGIKDFEDLMSNHVKDTDSGLKITATDGSSMFLKGVDADDLTADMFIF